MSEFNIDVADMSGGVDVEGCVEVKDESEVYADIYITNTYKGIRHSQYLMDEVKKAFMAGYVKFNG